MYNITTKFEYSTTSDRSGLMIPNGKNGRTDSITAYNGTAREGRITKK